MTLQSGTTLFLAHCKTHKTKTQSQPRKAKNANAQPTAEEN